MPDFTAYPPATRHFNPVAEIEAELEQVQKLIEMTDEAIAGCEASNDTRLISHWRRMLSTFQSSYADLKAVHDEWVPQQRREPAH